MTDENEYLLGELLAVIHRDGGHYRAEHGARKATTDAITTVLRERTMINEMLETARAEALRECDTALHAAEQNMSDMVEVWENGAGRIVLEQALLSMKHDGLKKVRKTRALIQPHARPR